MKEIIAADLPVAYKDEGHVYIGEHIHPCTGPRLHVKSTGEIENFSLLPQFQYDPIQHQYLLVGLIRGARQRDNIRDLNLDRLLKEGPCPPERWPLCLSSSVLHRTRRPLSPNRRVLFYLQGIPAAYASRSKASKISMAPPARKCLAPGGGPASCPRRTLPQQPQVEEKCTAQQNSRMPQVQPCAETADQGIQGKSCGQIEGFPGGQHLGEVGVRQSLIHINVQYKAHASPMEGELGSPAQPLLKNP